MTYGEGVQVIMNAILDARETGMLTEKDISGGGVLRFARDVAWTVFPEEMSTDADLCGLDLFSLMVGSAISSAFFHMGFVPDRGFVPERGVE